MISDYQSYGFNNPLHPFWLASTKATNYPSLDTDLQVDVAIVGGGLVGITSAYLLKQQGIRVAVIESDRIAEGTTGHTTAKLTSQHGLTYHKLISHLGEEKAQLYADANEYAIDFVLRLVREQEIDCDFMKQAAVVYTQSDNYLQQIENELSAASKLGLEPKYLEDVSLPFDIKGAIKFEDQAQFHPRKFILALAEKIPGDGSYLFENSRAVDFHEDNPNKVITEKGHTVTADKVIISSHFPVYGSGGYYFSRMYPERAYALGVYIKEEYPGGMYVTAEKPGRSLRYTPHQGKRLLIIAGERHKPGKGPNTNQHYQNLLEFANKHYTVTDIPYRWSTQDYTTLDDIPYVGQITSQSPDVFVATGFKKWGMTNGIVSANY